MFEWIILVVLLTISIGLNLVTSLKSNIELNSFRSTFTDLMFQYKSEENETYKNFEHDLQVLRSHNEHIIHSIKECITSVERLNIIMLELIKPKVDVKKQNKSGRK